MFSFFKNSLLTLPFLLLSHNAMADISVHFTEYKIFMDKNKPFHNYNIFNQGNSTAECKLSFIDYNITANGDFQIIKKGDSSPINSAVKKLRLSPKQVNITAKSSQKVKVIVRGIRNFPDGELHSYLSINCSEANLTLKKGINLSPNFIYNIPITIRKGELTATAEIKNLKVENHNNSYSLTFNMLREGNRSLYGDFTVTDETGDKIGEVTGFSHYLQAKSIPVSITLTSAPHGKITVDFMEQKRFGGDVNITKSTQ
ncbi:MAG: hypothetical protein ACJAXJ_000209 [Colwellia sp.]|jgi:hypothetical protein